MTGLGLAGLALMGIMMGGMLLVGHRAGRGSTGHGKAEPATAVCPVSGNRIAVSSAAVQATVGGKVYYFDNEDHQREFVLNPDKFSRGAAENEDGH